MSGELTLRGLLAHPGAGGLELLAGSDAVWEQVQVEADEAALPPATRALAVLTGPAPATGWHLDVAVRRLSVRGYTGLALPPDAPADRWSLAVADRLGVAVLRSAHTAALVRACWELLESRDGLALGYVRRVARTIEYRARGLDDLLAHLAAGVGHPLALVGPDGVVTQVGEPLPDAVGARLDGTAWLDLVEVNGWGAASVRVDAERRPGLRLVFHGPGLDPTTLRALGTAAEVAMPAVAARILIDEVVALAGTTRASGLLGDFLERRGRRDPELEDRMARAGWRVTGHHLGFRVIARGETDPVDLLELIERRLPDLPVAARATTRGRGVTGWLTFDRAPAADQVERAVGALRAVHRAVLAEVPVATGIGTLGDGAAGLYATLVQATDAARLAQGRASTQWFLHIDRLGLHQLLVASTGSDTFRPAAESLLRPLPAELVRTLRVYLDHESQVVAAAHALGLHRNTLSARIARVQDLLGVDLDDPDVRLAVHLACRTVEATTE